MFVLDVEKEKFVEELRAIVAKAQDILQMHSLVCRLMSSVSPVRSVFDS